MQQKLSIIIPAYNEAVRLPPTFDPIVRFFADRSKEYFLHEVIVVDDGSRDETVSVALSYRDRLPISVRTLPENRGKGAAVRDGMLAATGDYLLLYDADGATPIEAVQEIWEAMKRSGAPIGIGTRVDETKDVKMKPHRRLIGRLYHALCRGLHPGIHDAACGCKLFRADVAKELFSRQRISRFAFDIEILAMAIRRGYTIVEVPVDWTAVEKSKVRLVRDGIQMFWCVFVLYLRKFTGQL